MPALVREIMEEHLRRNFIPPIPAAFADAANRAIEACEDGDYGRVIEYGEGLSANGRPGDTAADIADSMRLWDLIADPDAPEAA